MSLWNANDVKCYIWLYLPNSKSYIFLLKEIYTYKIQNLSTLQAQFQIIFARAKYKRKFNKMNKKKEKATPI